MLQVDLVADAGARRHHAEVAEGALAPAQEGVALAVALELHVHVLLEGIGPAEGIDHDRMVDHQVDRRERIDLLRIAAQLGHGLAHGGQVHHRRHAGEVLHQHPRRAVGDLPVGATVVQPGADRLDVVHGDRVAVLVAQQVLQQDLQRIGQARHVADPGLGRGRQGVVVVGGAAHIQAAAGFQAVLSCAHGLSPPVRGLAPLVAGPKVRPIALHLPYGGFSASGRRRPLRQNPRPPALSAFDGARDRNARQPFSFHAPLAGGAPRGRRRYHSDICREVQFCSIPAARKSVASAAALP